MFAYLLCRSMRLFRNPTTDISWRLDKRLVPFAVGRSGPSVGCFGDHDDTCAFEVGNCFDGYFG